MAIIFILGLILSAIIGIIYFAFAQKSTNLSIGLSWKKCFLNGLQIYFMSLFLGTLATVVFDYISDRPNNGFSSDLIVQCFGLLMYAILFTIFIVAPAIIIGLKAISKTKLSQFQKELGFAAITFVLVVIVNIVMSGFLSNYEFVKFLSGFSFFGIVTPWAFVKLTKVFQFQQQN